MPIAEALPQVCSCVSSTPVVQIICNKLDDVLAQPLGPHSVVGLTAGEEG